MIECVWIRIRDGANPIEVLQRAHDAMGDDGDIISLKPDDKSIVDAIHNDPEAMKMIRQGVADIKAGRVQPWSEVKKELGL